MRQCAHECYSTNNAVNARRTCPRDPLPDTGVRNLELFEHLEGECGLDVWEAVEALLTEAGLVLFGQQQLSAAPADRAKPAGLGNTSGISIFSQPGSLPWMLYILSVYVPLPNLGWLHGSFLP